MHDLGEGTFRFTRVSYDPISNLPYLRVMDDGGKFWRMQPQGEFTLSFDTSTKKCIGNVLVGTIWQLSNAIAVPVTASLMINTSNVQSASKRLALIQRSTILPISANSRLS